MNGIETFLYIEPDNQKGKILGANGWAKGDRSSEKPRIDGEFKDILGVLGAVLGMDRSLPPFNWMGESKESEGENITASGENSVPNEWSISGLENEDDDHGGAGIVGNVKKRDLKVHEDPETVDVAEEGTEAVIVEETGQPMDEVAAEGVELLTPIKETARQFDKALLDSLQAGSPSPLDPLHSHDTKDISAGETWEVPDMTEEKIFNRVLDRISDKIGVSFRSGLNKATINLDPPSLGRLKIEITVDDNSVRTTIVADHSAVKDVIENGLNDLKNALLQQGLKIDNLTVLLGGGSAGKERWPDSDGGIKWARMRSSGVTLLEIDPAMDTLSKGNPGYGLVDIYI